MSFGTVFLGFDFSSGQCGKIALTGNQLSTSSSGTGTQAYSKVIGQNKATFYKLTSSDSFCDGPKNNKLATQLLGAAPTGAPLQTYSLSSNKTFPDDKNIIPLANPVAPVTNLVAPVTNLVAPVVNPVAPVTNPVNNAIPLNGTSLVLTNPCAKCNYSNNSQINYLTLGLYSDIDATSGYDGMVLRIYNNNNTCQPKIINAALLRFCVQSNVIDNVTQKPIDFLTAYIATRTGFIPKLIPNEYHATNTLTMDDIMNATMIQIDFYTGANLMVKSSYSENNCCLPISYCCLSASSTQHSGTPVVPPQIQPTTTEFFGGCLSETGQIGTSYYPFHDIQSANLPINREEFTSQSNAFCISKHLIMWIIIILIILLVLFYFYKIQFKK